MVNFHSKCKILGYGGVLQQTFLFVFHLRNSPNMIVFAA